jgi:hypothetical protein
MTLLALAAASLPALAFAQAAAPDASSTPPAATSDSATPAQPPQAHHEHGPHHRHRAELRQKYEQLTAADKAKFDDLNKQIRSLRQEQMKLLGVGKS